MMTYDIKVIDYFCLCFCYWININFNAIKIKIRFPNGMGNDSGELGHNLMDHHFQVGASGKFEGLEDKIIIMAIDLTGIYIPKFRNIGGKTNRKDFKRLWLSGWS